MCYTCNFIAGSVKKRLSFAIFFSYLIFFHLVVEVCHSPHHHLSKRAFLICKLHMRRMMIENDTDLLKFYTRKAMIGAGTGRLHLVVIGLVFSLYALAV